MANSRVSFRGRFDKETASILINRSGEGDDERTPMGENEDRKIHPLPARMVLRDLPFYQSRNIFAVTHTSSWTWSESLLLRHDWFHVFLTLPTFKSLSMLLGMWTVLILVFAWIYMIIDRKDVHIECGLGQLDMPISFESAFAFALETCTTVGYGLPSGSNAFFENCPGLQFIIFLQMLASMLFNAFVLAFLFLRISKSDSRGVQVVFSNKAIVTRVGDQVRFQFRVYDMDSHLPVVEAHVRVYCLSRGRPVPQPLRLQAPNDDLGAVLLMSLPAVISHHIDVFSHMHPAPPTTNSPLISSQGLILRQADGDTGNRDNIECPVCGETYGTYQRWRNHVRYQQLVESNDKYPVVGFHRELPSEGDPYWVDAEKAVTPVSDIAYLKRFFQEEIAEIVCVVEGIDPPTSGTFQALQSYRFQDIVWEENVQFEPCLIEESSTLQVDLDRFHRVRKTQRQSPMKNRSNRIADAIVWEAEKEGPVREESSEDDSVV